MLTRIRERATGWIAWILVIIITVPFALWGINSYLEGLNRIDVAVVNGHEIDFATYQNAVTERRRALLQTLGRNVDPSYFSTTAFKELVLNELIDEILIQEDIREHSYRISDAQLARHIQSTPEFLRDGNFDRGQYEDLVRRIGYSVAQFEALQRQRLSAEQIRRGFSDTPFVTRSHLEDIIRLLEQRRDARYVVLSADQFVDEVGVSDEEIAKEYETNRGRYRSPEQMRAEYLELSVDALAERIDPTEEELREHYQQNLGRFETPERRRASHILIKIDDTEDDDAARRQAVKLVAEAQGGADFAALARDNSDDSGSAANGGDLGIINPGSMVEPFEQAVFSMVEGEVRGPVRTRFGYHIIKLTELVAAEEQSFEDARADVLARERARQAELQFVELAETFRNLVYEHDTLEAAADELELDIQQSDWFSRDEGTGIFANPSVREAAFGEEVLDEERNSEVLELDIDALVAVHRLEHREAADRLLEAVSDTITQSLLTRNAAERAEEVGRALLAELNEGMSWEDVLTKHGLQDKTLSRLRTDPSGDEERQISEYVFRAPTPINGEPVFGGDVLDSNAFAVYMIEAVTLGDPDSVEDSVRQSVRAELERRFGFEYFLAYRHGLRDQAGIEIFWDQL